MQRSYDSIVVGGGVTGLSIARALKLNNPSTSVLVIEKEAIVAMHASGRNSGVLHSAINYPAGSLKARLCLDGHRKMREFCEQEKIAVNACGKIIVPATEREDQALESLLQQAATNQVQASIIDQPELQEREPAVVSFSGRALRVENSAVVHPGEVMMALHDELLRLGVEFKFSELVVDIRLDRKILATNKDAYNFGTLYNASGMYADRLAHLCGVGEDYRMLAIRGRYYELAEKSNIDIRGLVYTVADPELAFSDVHFTPRGDGHVLLGPSAVVALGREHYLGMRGIELNELRAGALYLSGLLFSTESKLKSFALKQMKQSGKQRLYQSASMIVPALKKEYLVATRKIGLRAQLLDTQTNQMEMDFKVLQAQNSVHVLNAPSPGFTSALSFGEYVVESNQ